MKSKFMGRVLALALSFTLVFSLFVPVMVSAENADSVTLAIFGRAHETWDSML